MKFYIDIIAEVIELIGVATIFVGCIYALYKFSKSFSKQSQAYILVRQRLGKAILLGLEILIAADIMATVVHKPTMDEVLVLAMIVIIRTFLSLSLQVELDGHFPWQRKTPKATDQADT
ncbi:MAG: hypothetical protein CSA53_01350 [Gammaproteobacteria bacterium]|nr:MAG: hypothetical protein CSA53_01350 [Gammaproteobacteria bacterium]